MPAALVIPRWDGTQKSISVKKIFPSPENVNDLEFISHLLSVSINMVIKELEISIFERSVVYHPTFSKFNRRPVFICLLYYSALR